MLPRRQQSAKRMRLPHDARGPMTVRQALLGALAVVFLFGVYFNFQFFTTLTTSTSSSIQQNNQRGRRGNHPLAGTNPEKKNPSGKDQLANTLAFETRVVKQIVFTSGCSEVDLIRSEVLAHSARACGYRHNITHLLYGCTSAQYESLRIQKNPEHGVVTHFYPEIAVETTLTAPFQYGTEQLTTTLHPAVIAAWLQKQTLKDDDFVMLVESDAFFTKNVDVWNLYREVEDIDEPQWFGQDAAWYTPRAGKLDPIPRDELVRVVPAKSRVLDVTEWREFAATAPYVAEVGVLGRVLPVAVDVWKKLARDKRYLAFPFAAAHHGIPFGISGVLNVHHYPSRYENWDFVDDVTHNPCNETAPSADVELASFPITVRAQNFTLPQWIDGRMWSFFDTQLPHDLLQCDAWLLREPSGYLWYLASHTSGYERVPTILRRRHTMSVCLALHAYNAALVAYKTKFCPLGFNTNKKIPMELNQPVWGSALALAPHTPIDDKTPTKYGEYLTKQDVVKREAVANRPGHVESDNLRFVFVTTCSPDDQWQSDVLAHSFARVQQRGKLTRIVSGCSDAALKALLKRSASVYPHLEIFATKSYATRPTPEMTTPDSYTPYNRPFGLRDWLRDANPPIYEDVIVILGVDFVFARPFGVNGGYRVTRADTVDSKQYDKDTEVIEGLRQYKRFFVYEGTRSLTSVTDQVADGVAIAQRWTTYMAPVVDGFGPNGDNRKVCPECKHVTVDDAREFYAVGPPYVMTRRDLVKLVDDYGALTVKKREMDRNVAMAEMIGLVLASSKHKIRFTTFDNLALAGKDDEYWGFTDLLKNGNPCADPITPLIIAETPALLQSAHQYQAVDGDGQTWIYDKSLVPDNIFACDVWLLAVPPASVWTEAKDAHDPKRIRHAYGVCTTIKMVNQAIVAQRQRVCTNGFNVNRKLRLVDPRPSSELEIGRVDPKWKDAAERRGQ